MPKFVIGFFSNVQNIETALNNLEEAEYDTKKSYLIKTDNTSKKNSSILGVKFVNSFQTLGIKKLPDLSKHKNSLCFCIPVEEGTENSAEEILKDSSAQKTIII